MDQQWGFRSKWTNLLGFLGIIEGLKGHVNTDRKYTTKRLSPGLPRMP